MESYDVGVLAVLTALILTQSQIDFAVDIDRIERVVPKLAQATGLDLKFDTMVAEDVVLVRAKSVTAADLLKQIAVAIDGEWVPTASGFRLSRPDAKMIECKRADALKHEAMTAKLSAEIGKRLQSATSKPGKAPAQLVRELRQFMSRQVKGDGEEFALYDAVSGILSSSPIGIAALESLANIGATRLAKVPVGESRVFSEQPRALGIQSNLISAQRLNQVESFLQQCHAQAVKQNLAAENEAGFSFRLAMRTALPPYLNAQQKKPVTDQITRTLMRVLRVSDQELEYQMLLVAPSGRIVASHLESISIEDDAKEGAFPVEQSDTARKLELDEVDLWVQSLQTNAGLRMTGSPTKEGATKFVPLLADPVANEPLSLYAKGVLLSVVDGISGNIVVSLPATDPVIVPMQDDPLTIADAKRELNRRLEKQSSGNWSVYRPMRRFAERNARIRRADLKRMYEYFVGGGVATHAMQAKLAYQYQDKAFEVFVNQPYQLMRTSTFVHQIFYSPELAFFGSLSDVEMTRVRAGVSLPQLSPVSRGLLNKLIHLGDQLVESAMDSDVDEEWQDGELTDVKKLVSEALPNGFAVTNRIQLSENVSPIAGAFQDNQWQGEIAGQGSTGDEVLRSIEKTLGRTPAMPFSQRGFSFVLSIAKSQAMNFGQTTREPLLAAPALVRDWPARIKKSFQPN